MVSKSNFDSFRAYSADEIEGIEDLSVVMVIWRGGNGCHEYVAKWKGSNLWVYPMNDMSRAVGSVYSKSNRFVLDQVMKIDPHRKLNEC